jgi:mannose-6-phosphate isomerase-like protein (cupin superfamily)
MSPDVPSAEQYAAERAQFGALEVIDLDALQLAVTEPYKNQVLLNANGECMRLAVFEGEYRWHRHPKTDELFLVISGELHIEFVDRAEAVLGPLQCTVVPAGTIHRTRAVGRTVNVTFEQQGAETLFVGPPNHSSPPTPLRGAT